MLPRRAADARHSGRTTARARCAASRASSACEAAAREAAMLKRRELQRRWTSKQLLHWTRIVPRAAGVIASGAHSRCVAMRRGSGRRRIEQSSAFDRLTLRRRRAASARVESISGSRPRSSSRTSAPRTRTLSTASGGGAVRGAPSAARNSARGRAPPLRAFGDRTSASISTAQVETVLRPPQKPATSAPCHSEPAAAAGGTASSHAPTAAATAQANRFADSVPCARGTGHA